jgi:hypothetical protein
MAEAQLKSRNSPDCRGFVGGLAALTGHPEAALLPLYRDPFGVATKDPNRRTSGEPPLPVRGGTTEAKNRGGPGRGYERLEFPGRICRHLPQYPTCFPRHERSKTELKALAFGPGGQNQAP